METGITSNNSTTSHINREGASIANENINFQQKLDNLSLEAIAELKLERFFNAVGTNYPDNLHKFIMEKVEKPLFKELLKRNGGNQVQTSSILGINRNTLRKKMKQYELFNKPQGM